MYERTDRFSCGHTYKVGKHGKSMIVKKCPTCKVGTYESSLVKTDEKMRPLAPVTEDRNVTFTTSTTSGTPLIQPYQWTTNNPSRASSRQVGTIFQQPTFSFTEDVGPSTQPHITYEDLSRIYNDTIMNGSHHTERVDEPITTEEMFNDNFEEHNPADVERARQAEALSSMRRWGADQTNPSPVPTFEQQREAARRLHDHGIITTEDFNERMDAIEEEQFANWQADEQIEAEEEGYGRDGEEANS